MGPGSPDKSGNYVCIYDCTRAQKNATKFLIFVGYNTISSALVMSLKWELQEKASDLRKRGLSYKDILKTVPVSKSTISRWCKDISLTKEQKSALGRRYDVALRGSKAVQSKRRAEVEKITEVAKAEIGTMLYWAEGNKTEFAGVTNSDPDLIRVMMKWFRDICKVPEDKFRAHLHIHSGQDEIKMKEYWSEVAGIPLGQFGKSFVKKEGSGHRKNVLYNGTIKINVFNKNLLHKILGWIEGFKSSFRGASSMVEQQTL